MQARPPCQRAAGACSALALVLVGVLGLLWCFISPPPFSVACWHVRCTTWHIPQVAEHAVSPLLVQVEIVEAPSFRRNDPALSVYLGALA